MVCVSVMQSDGLDCPLPAVLEEGVTTALNDQTMQVRFAAAVTLFTLDMPCVQARNKIPIFLLITGMGMGVMLFRLEMCCLKFWSSSMAVELTVGLLLSVWPGQVLVTYLLSKSW